MFEHAKGGKGQSGEIERGKYAKLDQNHSQFTLVESTPHLSFLYEQTL